jgi:hypothetical protein
VWSQDRNENIILILMDSSSVMNGHCVVGKVYAYMSWDGWWVGLICGCSPGSGGAMIIILARWHLVVLVVALQARTGVHGCHMCKALFHLSPKSSPKCEAS